MLIWTTDGEQKEKQRRIMDDSLWLCTNCKRTATLNSVGQFNLIAAPSVFADRAKVRELWLRAGRSRWMGNICFGIPIQSTESVHGTHRLNDFGGDWRCNQKKRVNILNCTGQIEREWQRSIQWMVCLWPPPPHPGQDRLNDGFDETELVRDSRSAGTLYLLTNETIRTIHLSRTFFRKTDR